MRLNLEPQSINDIIFPNPHAKATVNRWINREFEFLGLYGPSSSGKSAAIRPIVQARIPDLDMAYDFAEHDCAENRDRKTLRDKIEAGRSWATNGEGKRVLVLEEVEQLAPDAAKSLKGFLNRVSSPRFTYPIIMVTNQLDAIEAAARARITWVHWAPSPEVDVFKRFQKVLIRHNVTTVDDVHLLRLVKRAHGNLRELRELVEAAI